LAWPSEPEASKLALIHASSVVASSATMCPLCGFFLSFTPMQQLQFLPPSDAGYVKVVPLCDCAWLLIRLDPVPVGNFPKRLCRLGAPNVVAPRNARKRVTELAFRPRLQPRNSTVPSFLPRTLVISPIRRVTSASDSCNFVFSSWVALAGLRPL